MLIVIFIFYILYSVLYGYSLFYVLYSMRHLFSLPCSILHTFHSIVEEATFNCLSTLTGAQRIKFLDRTNCTPPSLISFLPYYIYHNENLYTYILNISLLVNIDSSLIALLLLLPPTVSSVLRVFIY